MLIPTIHPFGRLPIAACDTECARNYWLCKFMLADDRSITSDFEIYDGHPLNIEDTRGTLREHTIVTFNGNHYDLPMITLALAGANTETLKEANDLIIVKQFKPWEIYRVYGLEQPDWIDHVDVKEPSPGVMVSLKVYGGRLNSKRLQDLPFDPAALVTPEQRPVIAKYCENDLHTTLDLMERIAPRLVLRAEMSKEYGIDLRSKSDAQIAEAVIKARIGGYTERPTWRHGSTFKYEVPAFIRFTTPKMQAVLEMVRAAEFVVTDKEQAVDDTDVKTGVQMPDELKKSIVHIGATAYKMGIGGLHSQEKSTTFAGPLEEFDVTSYYPSIILGLGLFPAQLGNKFLEVYRAIFDTRVHAKIEAARLAGTPEGARFAVQNEGLKIVLNGSFGKFGSKWSILFSPTLLIQTTITGQLALLMLIEALEECCISVVSANTDGIVTKCPAGFEDWRAAIIADWEQRTGFNMESTHYAALHSRDVNNYVAVKPDGKVKTKGVFASAGLAKSPANSICTDAVVAYLAKGTPIEETIVTCTDVSKFLTIRNVTGGAVKGSAYLGKAVRWAYRAGEMGTINYATNGNRVPKSEGAWPVMEMPETFPDWLDYTWYFREAYAMLSEIGVDGSVNKA